ncbi:hypothetical protein BD324DRAFT_682236 [Kockovaella imperatae]|uniref:Uncharacterized protein n=1 Tax=Kockovaella imperatae TaxID=4999 RepID=A0A1Y1UDH7_9TREE|nr:hypothetical protein BD324DRAFT_682236 [Kockovaella imperatae]ORX36100.1 hypothetical protein BD324DRAFT_682236 [Kockovaella imperatae]
MSNYNRGPYPGTPSSIPSYEQQQRMTAAQGGSQLTLPVTYGSSPASELPPNTQWVRMTGNGSFLVVSFAGTTLSTQSVTSPSHYPLSGNGLGYNQTQSDPTGLWDGRSFSQATESTEHTNASGGKKRRLEYSKEEEEEDEEEADYEIPRGPTQFDKNALKQFDFTFGSRPTTTQRPVPTSSAGTGQLTIPSSGTSSSINEWPEDTDFKVSMTITATSKTGGTETKTSTYKTGSKAIKVSQELASDAGEFVDRLMLTKKNK